MTENIQTLIQNIKPLYQQTMEQTREYQDNLIKPIGSLGRLEDIAIQIAGITGSVKNELDKKAIIVCR